MIFLDKNSKRRNNQGHISFFLLLLFVIFSACHTGHNSREVVTPTSEVDLNGVYFDGDVVVVLGQATSSTGQLAKLQIKEITNDLGEDTIIKEIPFEVNEKFTVRIKDLKVGQRYRLGAFLLSGGTEIKSSTLEYEHSDKIVWKLHPEVPKATGFHEFTAISHSPFIYLYQPLNTQASRFLTYSEHTNSWKISTSEWFQRDTFRKPRHSPFMFYYKLDLNWGGGYFLQEEYGAKRDYRNDLTGEEVRESYPGTPSERLNIPVVDGLCVLEKAHPENFWLFDMPLWERLPPFPGKKATDYKGTNYGNKVYVISESTDRKDMQEVFYFSLSTNTWIKLPDFPGESRTNGIVFSLNDKLYYGTGISNQTNDALKDIWEFDLSQNLWRRAFTYCGKGDSHLTAVRMQNRIFIGLGFKSVNNSNRAIGYYKAYDFWELLIDL